MCEVFRTTDSADRFLFTAPEALFLCSSRVSPQFRETKARVTGTWPSTSAGICAPLFATMRSLTHRWVSTLQGHGSGGWGGGEGEPRACGRLITPLSSRITRPWTCSVWITCWKTAGAASTVRATCTLTTAPPFFCQRFVTSADRCLSGSMRTPVIHLSSLCSLTQVYYSDFNPYQPLSSPKVGLMVDWPTRLACLIQRLFSSLLCCV